MSDLIDALPLLEKLDELIHEVWCIGHLTSDQIALRRSIRMHDDEEITHRKIWPHTNPTLHNCAWAWVGAT